MGSERFPGARLRLVRDTTPDPVLREELGALLGEVSVRTAPSRTLADEIDECRACASDGSDEDALCEPHRARYDEELRLAERAWRPLAAGAEETMRDALPDGSRVELLATIRAQSTALRLVIEAHRRGAAQLPEGLRQVVQTATSLTPAFLGGAARQRRR